MSVGNTEEDEVWDIMDALCDQTQQSMNVDHKGSISLIQALSTDLDASAFGARGSGTVTPKDWDNDMDIPNFPPLSQEMLEVQYGGKNEGVRVPRTSEPVRKTTVRDGQEDQLVELVTKKRFRDVLETPMGLVRFREWVTEEGRAESRELLRCYEDMRAYERLAEEVKAVTQGMQAVYGKILSQDTSSSQWMAASSSMSLDMHSAQTKALDKLYSTEFKRFIAGKITERARARLELFPAHSERGDLGEVFCIADPRLPDQPLVYVSDGFCRLSEYPRSRLVGRNCRFLQGPATDRDAVKALREAINAGREHCSLLLNYSRTGRPFWNLLNMVPLRNANGQVDFFLGAQINVSRALTSQDAFETLLGSKRIEGENGQKAPLFTQDVLKQAETILGRPTALRPPPIQRPPARTSDSTTSISPTPTLVAPSSGKMHKWLSASSRAKSSEQGIALQPYPRDPLAPVTFDQRVPDAVRDQIEVFTSAYSNMIVFDAKARLIQYVTAPLLARLGYPIKTAKDRLASHLLRADAHYSILSVVTGQTAANATSTRNTISGIISERKSHSLFAGVALAGEGRGREGGEISYDGKRYTRCLLHFTPLKDGQDEAQLYVVVVG